MHRDSHPSYVEGCFRCKLETVSIAPSASGSKQARAVNSKEASWQKDHAAYKRLRGDGLQPTRIDGCFDLEKRAATQQEIERGHLYSSPAEAKEIEAGMAKARDIGMGL